MTLLSVQDLSVALPTESGMADVVRGIGFSLDHGETLGIVGESGSGKSMTGLALIGLLPRRAVTRGTILLDGVDLLALDEEAFCAMRGNRVAMVFQEPMTSLNPVHRIGDQVAEPLIRHRAMARQAALGEAARLLDRVGIPEARARLAQYPHELSGGQRQRVMIAMALACRPALLIADEPTSALDVTVQAQLIALLREIVAEDGTALILISHDLSVVGRLCARTMVFYAGAIAEEGPTRSLLAAPSHPYTQGLLAALPRPGRPRGERLATIPGQVPSPSALPPGCAFFGRCPRGDERCRTTPPPGVTVAATRAYCFHPGPTA